MGSAWLILHALMRFGWMAVEIGRVMLAGLVSLAGGSTSGGPAAASVSGGGDVECLCCFAVAFVLRTGLRVASPAFRALFERRKTGFIVCGELGGGR